MISNILHDLLTNAIKFSHKRKRIEIEADNFNNEMLEIGVRNFGTGIPKAEQDILFKTGHNVAKNGTAN